jgi:signal transduction histidine kinase
MAVGWRNVPVRRKLTIVVMAASGGVLTLACGSFLAFHQVASRETAARKLSALAGVVAAQSSAVIAFTDLTAAREVVAGLTADPEIVTAVLYGKDGAALAHQVRGGGLPPADPGPDGTRFDGANVLVTVPVLQEGRRIGTFHLRSDLGSARAAFRQGVVIVAIVLSISAVAALALSLQFGAVFTRPILALAAAVRSVSAGKGYDVQVAGHGKDEVGQLIDGFNEMLSGIRERDAALQKANEQLLARVLEVTEAQKRLEENYRQIEGLNRTLAERQAELRTYHDLVTHDVTNFAGTLMGIVDALLAQPEEALAPKQRELLRRANRQVFQLNHLAANAKTLARLREKGLPPSSKNVPLQGVLRKVGETVRAVHFDRDVRVKVECPEEVQVPEIPFMEHVFLNLVDNAVRHGPREGAAAVRLVAERDNGHVEVRVQGGNPMDDAALGGLFDRYARGPGSKGTGLGLSVVREIVERAGGTVEAVRKAEREGDAFEVRLTLPGV